MTINVHRARAFSKNWRPSTTIPMIMAFNSSNRMISNWHMRLVSSHSPHWSTTKLAFQLCMMVSSKKKKWNSLTKSREGSVGTSQYILQKFGSGLVGWNDCDCAGVALTTKKSTLKHNLNCIPFSASSPQVISKTKSAFCSGLLIKRVRLFHIASILTITINTRLANGQFCFLCNFAMSILWAAIYNL